MLSDAKWSALEPLEILGEILDKQMINQEGKH